MRLARALPRLDPENAQRVADFSLRDALGALASQSVDLRRLPADVAERVLADAGEERLRDVLHRALIVERRPSLPPDDGDWTVLAHPPPILPPEAEELAVHLVF
jgi:hypothetical protein